jgi:hypothetical protein
MTRPDFGTDSIWQHIAPVAGPNVRGYRRAVLPLVNEQACAGASG